VRALALRETTVDIIAHGLLTAATAIAVRRRWKRPVRIGLATFFGILPDLVSFTVPATLRVWWRITGATQTLLSQANGPHFEWVRGLYNRVHSPLVSGIVFAASDGKLHRCWRRLTPG
jgi:hypothetical protein